MNENLNLVEILKDCPKGTKLYSTVFGKVEFKCIEKNAIYPIIVRPDENTVCRVTADGRTLVRFYGECTLFPSREQRDWSKFNPPCEFKDGDILSYQNKCLKNRTIYIYRYRERVNTSYYVALSGNENETLIIDNEGKWALNGYDETVCFATEEEKQKLFDAIKENGYKWNAETKTLEKLIKPKFDPKTLKPFDKILARNGHSEIWNCDVFSNINDNEPYKFNTISNYWKYCIPYNDETKHLVGTKEEAPEYYRYWED